jgi:hypothetical protein
MHRKIVTLQTLNAKVFFFVMEFSEFSGLTKYAIALCYLFIHLVEKILYYVTLHVFYF